MLVITKKVEEIDVFHQMRSIITHGFSGRVIVFPEDIDKLNFYLVLINKEFGFEVSDVELANKDSLPSSGQIETVLDKNGPKTGNGKKANKQEIVNYIKSVLSQTQLQGKTYVILRTGDVEKAVGLSQRIVSVCHAMYDCMKTNDEVLSAPPSGYSTTVTIKYCL